MTTERRFLRRSSAIAALLVLVAVSGFAQTRPAWRTSAEIRSGEAGSMTGTITRLDTNGFGLASDEESATTAARVETTGSTRYTGLGVDAAQTETGAAGFRQLRIGDRVTVSGTGGPAATIRANAITLIGRAVQTGTAGTGVLDTNRFLEGRILEIRINDQSFVIESDQGVRTTIVGTRDTPVVFQGQTYSMRNLEQGDRVRVEIDARLSSGEIRARRIEVTEDSTPDDVSSVRSQNYLTGRVTNVEARANRFTVAADRAGQVRVEAGRAVDGSGRAFRVGDLQVGDRLRVWGSYTSQQVFRAERIEFGTADDIYRDDEFRDRGEEAFEGYSTVIFFGTIERNPANEDKITIRDRDSRRDIEIVVDEEFVVLREGGSTFLRAAQLRSGDRVVVKAFRDRAGNYVAQTIRLQ